MGTQHSLSIHTTLPLFYRREQKIYLKVPGFLRSPLPLPRLLRNPGNPKRSRVSALAPLVNVSHCGKVRWGAIVAYPVGQEDSMGVEYPPAIDMFIDDPAWVFTNALQGLSGDQLSIIIHKTACNGFCSATDVANSFHNDTKDHKSAHFIVGRDGSVIQVVRLRHGAGGNCCVQPGYDPYWDPYLKKYANLNKSTISIEHEA